MKWMMLFLFMVTVGWIIAVVAITGIVACVYEICSIFKKEPPK